MRGWRGHGQWSEGRCRDEMGFLGDEGRGDGVVGRLWCDDEDECVLQGTEVMEVMLYTFLLAAVLEAYEL